jgi:hypothetical protein
MLRPHRVSIWFEAEYDPSITNQTHNELWVIERNVGRSLSLRTLTHKLDWVAFNPLVAHSVMEDCAHDIPNLRSCALCPLDAVQPFFNSYRLDVLKPVIHPARKNPASGRLPSAHLAIDDEIRLPPIPPRFSWAISPDRVQR